MQSNKLTRYARITMIFVIVLGIFSIVYAQDPPMNDYGGVTRIEGHDPTASEVFGMATDATIEEVTGDHETYYGTVVTLDGYVAEFISSNIFVLDEEATLDNDKVLVVNNSSYTLPPEIMKDAHLNITGLVHPSMAETADGVVDNAPSLFVMGDVDMDSDVDTDMDVDTDTSNVEATATVDNVNTTSEDMVTPSEGNDTDTETDVEATPMDGSDTESNTEMTATPMDSSDTESDTEIDATPMDSVTESDTSTMGNQVVMMRSRPNLVQFVQQGYLPDDFDAYTIIEIVNWENVEYIQPEG